MDKSVDTVDRPHGIALRRELAEVKAENRYLRVRIGRLRSSRDYWKREAENWKWQALG